MAGVVTHYRAPGPGALRIVPLDALTALYHRPSGTTHLLVAPAPEILEVLADRWLTAADLLAALAERFDLADAGEAPLARRLDELVDAGLVEAR